MRFKKIVVTTDFSEHSLKAFEWAAYQAKMDGSEIIVVHVLEDLIAPPLFAEFDLSGLNAEAIQEQYKEGVRKRLGDYVAKYFHGQNVRTELITKQGSVSESLANFTKTESVDLICMATAGRGAISLLGTVAERLIRNAPCPVLLIPTHN